MRSLSIYALNGGNSKWNVPFFGACELVLHLEPCGIVVESGLSSEERERKAWDINLPFAVGESSYFPVAFFYVFFLNAVLSSELCVLGGYS